MLLFLLAIIQVVHATTFCTSGECWTGLGGCVVSGPGVACIACNGQGYVDGSGNCVFELFSFDDAPVVVESTCPNRAQCRFQGECQDSQEGVRCEECNGNGYLVYDFDLNTTECICATNQFNPLQACTILFDTNFEIINESATLSNINCDAHQQNELGFFRQPEIGESPNQCFSEVYGPAPGVLTDANPNEPLFTCNTYCGENPSQPRGCETCAGNGFWDRDSYSCVCDEGFTAQVVGQDFFGNDARVCNACWGYRGPFEGGGFCDAIYTPDPVDGAMRECGGHGLYDRAECICYSNMTAGFWDTTAVSGFFKRTEGNGTVTTEFQSVQSCVRCQSGFALPNCIEEDPDSTFSPTAFPTSDSPTESPTRSPISACETCNEVVFNNQTFFADLFSVNYSTVQIPNCSARNFTIGFNFVNSTDAGLQANVDDATRICQYTPLCRSWTFHLIGEAIFFYFFESTGGVTGYPLPAFSINAQAGAVCEVLQL